ncbi:MAG TPA: sigma-70 family RNA polymerase sigma factor [Acidimicrobiales bacterium]|nr:sigma-70 family RNA polymerase sigma factor [Acidimicrobiales bacterium]
MTPGSLERSPGDASTRPDLEPLVRRARAGDADAWEALYRQLYPRLVAYARRGLDEDRARDAVGEAMARAVAAIKRFEWEGAGFEAWLFSILRHVVADGHRRTARENRLARGARDRVDDEATDRLISDDEGRSLRAAFSRLGTSDQELLHLRVVSGLSSEETAALLGKRPGAVRMAQARALERLRRLLEKDDP